ncbi:type III secretion system gatekeeper subunit MxiC, partial [Shigella flexneri]
MLDVKNTGVFSSAFIDKLNAMTNSDDGDETADAELDSGLANSKYIDSSDEMASALSSFINRRDLEKLKGTNSDSQERILDGEEDEINHKIFDLKRTLKDNLPLDRDFIDRLKRYFKDPSDQVLALRELLNEKDLTAEQVELLTKIINEIISGSEKSVNAGINSAIQAKLFGNKMKLEPQLLRACYRGFIMGNISTTDQYIEWLGNFGFNHRHTIVNFVEQSLIVDMDSEKPSCNAYEFGFVLSKLIAIKMIRTSDVIFMKKLESSSLLKDGSLSAEQLLLTLLYIFQYPSESEQILTSVIEVSRAS